MILYLSISIVAIVIIWYIFHLRKYEDIQKLPGPSTLSLIKFQPSKYDIFTTLTNLNKIYGPIVKLWMNPLKPMLIVTDTKYIEHLLTSNIHLDKSDFYELFDSFAGQGLVTCEASLWKAKRKLLNPAFSNKNLEEYAETFESISNNLVDELTSKINGDFFDVLPIMNMYTFRMVFATVMNLEDDMNKQTIREYLRFREDFFSIVSERAFSPLKRLNFVYRLTRAYVEQEKLAENMKKFATEILTKYKNQSESKHAIDYLLDEYDLDDPQLLQHINTIIAAGHETTSTALSSALYEISRHPDIQRKIVEESIFIQGNQKQGKITFGDAQRMKYLECVIKETLRLHPTLPFFDRKIAEDIIINGVRIPKGTDVSICVYNLHLNDTHFPNPLIFNPDRFLPENVDEVKPFTYIPFSAGPRNCIGKHFGMLKMKVTLTKILRNFELHQADIEEEMKFYTEFALRSSVGWPIRLKPRLLTALNCQ